MQSKTWYDILQQIINSDDFKLEIQKYGYYIIYVTPASSFDNPENVEIRDKFIKSIRFLP